MSLLKNDSKVICYNDVKHKFSPAPSFPPGKLPTEKDVIQCILSYPNFLKRVTAGKVSKVLTSHWVHCNVYHLSEQQVTAKIYKLMQLFQRLAMKLCSSLTYLKT